MKTKTRSISLTENIQVNEGSHIAYFYQSEEAYLDNLISFILSAKKMEQHVIVIESDECFAEILNRLRVQHPLIDVGRFLHFLNNREFYQTYGDFHFERALNNFKKTVQPFVDETLSVRIWGKVSWTDLHSSQKEMINYECMADLTLNEIGYMTVCTYDANEVTAAVQMEMMKTHAYLMTDKELVKSSLYNHTDQPVFPSLATQDKIETELDFYRQKLDFIHVVAHEVRNPLTVIKSFATILKSELDNPDIQAKLSLIEDYSVAIDHEIHHIIQTEQMLSIDSLWKMTLIQALPVIEEVVDVMTVKARTQNIYLETQLDISRNKLIMGNLMGFKLILSNILSNAIKYSHENNVVTLRGFIENNHLHLHIIDRGVGMTPEQLEKIFGKYEKLNEEVPGQGIGLFMVYKLVQHFNGKINVKSQLGKGTSFYLSFSL
ncbi:MEDS domain-containing protein [Halalkalibacter urbisdiaboli]|uniref:MEDS domain-containing protein n=1 Tax=Halalkalibacter urbisdiaboli TaxID=1960589 RepID=UPI000B434AAE|nr:MEDS domain-containing protein [Halalkalibacter urbisdiaboli]